MIVIKIDCSKLKVWSVEMPNAPYSNRYLQAEKRQLDKNELEATIKREEYFFEKSV